MSVFTRNRYEPGTGKAVSEAGVWCHLGGSSRESSFALGDGRGSNGLGPGVKGARVPFVPNDRWQRAKAKRDRKQAR